MAVWFEPRDRSCRDARAGDAALRPWALSDARRGGDGIAELVTRCARRQADLRDQVSKIEFPDHVLEIYSVYRTKS